MSLLRQDDTPYIVSLHIPQGRLLHAGKECFAYFLTVLNFRKVVNRQKIGSPENSRPVILFRFYKPGCNLRWLKLHHEKDE
ncbi:hypothetical protein DOR57_23240 [Salmonella enterica subsp. salamae]|uniref:Transposase n=1 Tax=Salmonella enterica subsp. enterica serovar Kottbus TaxID=224727 RepID=A0A5J0SCI3_SALET|nr:hypothetical protein [Salmonella enterica subsp. enterica serovar Kottbus]ECG0942779.1 hypothetical protein [Salmonella enterica subsp. salamae]EDJ1504974.1 hypothetical protein [Salmonella enterica]EDM0594538.1 hypothetical protein [Salmonella enterica subsp. enterica serovar Cerro]EDN4397050.1 hypothetical protein [Salmonella enterica subsp. enterica]